MYCRQIFLGRSPAYRRFCRRFREALHARIVNISSVNGLRGTPNSTAYNASKAALISLTQSMAIELSARGITVNAIAPGFVDTRMSKLPDGSSEYETDWFKEVYIKHRSITGGPASLSRRYRRSRGVPVFGRCPVHYWPGAGGRWRGDRVPIGQIQGTFIGILY